MSFQSAIGTQVATPDEQQPVAETSTHLGKNQQSYKTGPRIIKRARFSQEWGIGLTLLRELHTPGSANFDPDFPRAFTLTKNGPLYFSVDAIERWVALRQLACASAPSAG